MTGFRFTNENYPQGVDFDKVFIPKDYFSTGGLWTWGDNGLGELGDNTRILRSSPVQTIAGGTNWKQISAGYASSAAIKTDGTLWVWGANFNGELGDGTTVSKSSPIQTIAGGTNWKQVSAGYNNISAIKTDGTLWIWGSNTNGMLGDNIGTTDRSSPVQTITGGNDWRLAIAGDYHQAAIKIDGTLWTWGRNNEGQIGDGTRTVRLSPAQTICGGNDWKTASLGSLHNVAIKTDGTLWCWGRNNNGQLGDGTVLNRSSPVQTIAGGNDWKFLSANIDTVVAIKTNGTLWCWGRNNNGQLGDGTTVSKSSPIQTIAGGTNWKTASTGYFSSAIKSDGTLWSWGTNWAGHLGDGTTNSKSSPVQTIAGGTNWKTVDCTSSGAVAIREDYY